MVDSPFAGSKAVMTVSGNPSPDEAARALRDAEHRRSQVRQEVRGPRWLLPAVAALVIGQGLAADLLSQPTRDIVTATLFLVLGGLVLVQYTRSGGSFLGFRARPQRWVHAPARYLAVLGLTLIGTIAVGWGANMLTHLYQLPYPRTINAVAAGLFLLLAGPWLTSLMVGPSKR
jgi:hypothetical protein